MKCDAFLNENALGLKKPLQKGSTTVLYLWVKCLIWLVIETFLKKFSLISKAYAFILL